MSRGIILELKSNKAVVLTPDGEFKRVTLSKGKYELGQEVNFRRADNRSIYRLGAIAAVLVFALLIPVIVNMAAVENRVYAYVELDINPSVEFIVNRHGRIIQARGLNPEGCEILEGTRLKGKDLDYGVEYFAVRSYDLGYAAAEGAHVLVTTTYEGEKEADLEQSIIEAIDRTVAEKNIPVKVDTLSATKEIKEQAGKAGISSGKYLILLQASEDQISLDIDDVKSKSVITAVKEAGGDIQDIIKKARKDKDALDQLLKKNNEKVMADTKGKGVGKGPVKSGTGDDRDYWDEGNGVSPNCNNGKQKGEDKEGKGAKDPDDVKGNGGKDSQKDGPKDDNGGKSPGKSGDAPGKSGDAPGKSGDAPGKSGDAPGKSGDNPGKSGDAPGKSGDNPGKSGDAPGKSGDAPGQGKNSGKGDNDDKRGADNKKDKNKPDDKPKNGKSSKKAQTTSFVEDIIMELFN